MQSALAFAVPALAVEFAPAPYGFGLFSRFALGGFFVVAAQLHFTKYAFALHLFFQGFERLVYIVVPHCYANQFKSPLF